MWDLRLFNGHWLNGARGVWLGLALLCFVSRMFLSCAMGYFQFIFLPMAPVGLTVTWSSVVGILKVGWLLPGVMFQGLLTSLLESPTEILFHWLSPCEES